MMVHTSQLTVQTTQLMMRSEYSHLIYNKGTTVILGQEGDHGLFNKIAGSQTDIHM